MKRSTIVVLVVFAIMLIAAVMINDRPVERGSEHLSFADLDLESVSYLRIEAPAADEPIEVRKADGVWRLADGHMADPDTVERSLEGLRSIDTSDVVSTSEERRANYGVDADGGVTVEAGAGSKKMARVVVGAGASGGGFARGVGSDSIFQTARSLKPVFPTDSKRWLKLKLVDTNIDEARRVEVQRADGSSYALVPAQTNDDWAPADPSLIPADFRFDGPGARALATTVLSIRATEIVDVADPAATGLEVEHDRFTVVSDAGSVTVHLGADSGDNTVYARVDGRDAVFEVAEYQANNLRKQLLDLRDLRLMSYPADQAVTLSVRTGADEIRLAKDETGVWVIDPEGDQPAEGYAFDANAAARLVQSLTAVKAQALSEGVSATQAGFDRAKHTISVGLGDGSTADLDFGKKVENDDGTAVYYASGNADQLVYTVNEYQRDRFARGWQLFEMVEPPPNAGGGNPFANLDPETLKNLPPEVRESLMKQMQEEQMKQQIMEQMRQQQGGGAS